MWNIWNSRGSGLRGKVVIVYYFLVGLELIVLVFVYSCKFVTKCLDW